MSTRIRGEHHRQRAAWRPSRPSGPPTHAQREAERQPRRQRSALRPDRLRGSRRWLTWALASALVALAGYLTTSSLLGPSTPRPPTAAELPATPRAWLDAYEAAAIDNPSRVCSRLLSPALAAAFGRETHSSCTTYFTRMSSSSVTVRRILHGGETAVLELRQTLDHRDWAVVLNHQSAGWRAVDLLDGHLLR